MNELVPMLLVFLIICIIMLFEEVDILKMFFRLQDWFYSVCKISRDMDFEVNTWMHYT